MLWLDQFLLCCQNCYRKERPHFLQILSSKLTICSRLGYISEKSFVSLWNSVPDLLITVFILSILNAETWSEKYIFFNLIINYEYFILGFIYIVLKVSKKIPSLVTSQRWRHKWYFDSKFQWIRFWMFKTNSKHRKWRSLLSVFPKYRMDCEFANQVFLSFLCAIPSFRFKSIYRGNTKNFVKINSELPRLHWKL